MPKSKRFQILLMASGPTEWDLTGRMTGAADLPLAPQGFDAITEAVEALNGESRPGVEVVLCSPDEASRSTAEVLARSIGARVRPIDGLAEVSLGLWEGVRGEDLEGRCPKLYKQWLDDPSRVSAPQGETLEDAQDRVLASLSKALTKAESQRVGLVLRPMAWALVHCRFEQQPISGLWQQIRDSVARPRWHEIDRNSLEPVGPDVRASA